MSELFGVDIASIVGDAMSGQLKAGTLTRSTPGTRIAGRETAGTQPTTVDYACEGIINSKSSTGSDGVKTKGKTLMILGASITIVPKAGDIVLLADEPNAYKLIELVNRDPAHATYEFKIADAVTGS